MLKSFREILETSVNTPHPIKPKSRRRGETRHYKAHVREPHVAHALRTGPTGQFDAGSKSVSEKVVLPEDLLETKKMTASQRLAKNLKRGGFDAEAHQKALKGIEDKYKDSMEQTKALLKARGMKVAEEAPAMSIANAAVPTLTDPTTNYAAQLKKRVLRRKKPQ